MMTTIHLPRSRTTPSPSLSATGGMPHQRRESAGTPVPRRLSPDTVDMAISDIKALQARRREAAS